VQCSHSYRRFLVMDISERLVAVVEDDAAMRKSIERYLQASGYATAGFPSAEEFLANSNLDCTVGLVLDIHLSGMSGIELHRHLSAMKSTIPIIFITARDDEATRLKALAAGCIEYLQKPFEGERLIQALTRSVRA
jgi:FixJ family two-component response regulator